MFVVCTGKGFNSPQQRSLQLLKHLDPQLCQALLDKKFVPGEYQWQDEFMPGLVNVVNDLVEKWMTRRPPWGYNEKNSGDMILWAQRRDAGLRWSKSVHALNFYKSLYCKHDSWFKQAIATEGRTDVKRCLKLYYHNR